MKPNQCRMGRAALNWSTQKLAKRSGVGANTVNRFEAGQDARVSSVDKMREAMETAGVVFVADGETSTAGEGVRLKVGQHRQEPYGIADEKAVNADQPGIASNHTIGNGGDVVRNG